MYITTKVQRAGQVALIAGLFCLSQTVFAGQYGFGVSATAAEIAAIDIDVMPDGRGAPPGEGTYEQGKADYMGQCAGCHGVDPSKPTKGTGAAALLGGRGSLTSGKPKKTVESYWPYASTFFDYVYRAMPFNSPGSLSPNQVYSITAYILGEAGITDKGATMNASALAAVRMPNRDGFIADPRPDVFNYD